MDFGTNWVNIHRQFYNYETGRHKVDKIKVDSIKNIARQKRGISSTKFNITDFQKNIPQCKNWNEFLNESEYKDHLIEMIKLFVLWIYIMFCSAKFDPAPLKSKSLYPP